MILCKDLPIEIQQLILIRGKEQGVTNEDMNISLGAYPSDNNFYWDKTSEGYEFWNYINSNGVNEKIKNHPSYPKQLEQFPIY